MPSYLLAAARVGDIDVAAAPRGTAEDRFRQGCDYPAPASYTPHCRAAPRPNTQASGPLGRCWSTSTERRRSPCAWARLFLFQSEEDVRYVTVTGVQTCGFR